MRIFAISDLHLCGAKQKEMDIFGDNWKGHKEKIAKEWDKNVNKDDLVLIPGDISWATKQEEVIEDLRFIDELPGKKVLIRGNHDYWWSTKKKLNEMPFESLEYIVNDSIQIDNIAICGVRGWDLNQLDKKEENEKIYKRELIRLEMSLKPYLNHSCKLIVMLHFPPFDLEKRPNDFVELLMKYKVDTCIYGHLHGIEGHKQIVEGNIDGINFHCVACDYLDFKIKEIRC